uniref:SH3 domain-containing YSC84-like protein 1 n=1 Tax=Cyprinus carpio TaxID=7962 RepID=A0A8C2EHP2_CYPCA
VNNPFPTNLKMGPDKLIPARVIAKAQGLAILSVFKTGFMITARGGSGIVIARLADGSKCIISGGFMGLEHQIFVIIWNQRRSVDAFSKAGNLTFGGNFTVAIGPLGRDLEADVAFHSTAAVYSYCKSRGLYAGVSLGGSYLIEHIHASAIFNGDGEIHQRLAEQTHASLKQDQASGGALVVTAVHPFTSQQPGDLSFIPGDRITVFTKTDPQYDWWEGELRGQVGIFPANFVSYS